MLRLHRGHIQERVSFAIDSLVPKRVIFSLLGFLSANRLLIAFYVRKKSSILMSLVLDVGNSTKKLSHEEKLSADSLLFLPSKTESKHNIEANTSANLYARMCLEFKKSSAVLH